MPEEELKPCPFCGGKNLELLTWNVRCTDCHTWGPADFSDEQAIKLWNKREESNV